MVPAMDDERLAKMGSMESGLAIEQGLGSDRSVLVFIEGADDSSILDAERRSHDQNVERGAAVLRSADRSSLMSCISRSAEC
jgi:hypothetical protein